VQEREHAAPGLAEHVVAAVDPQVRGQRRQLALEQLRGPERRIGVGQVVGPAVAELVVEDARAAGALVKLGDRLDVVVGRAGAAVAKDHRGLWGIRIEVADHAIPRSMPFQREVALHGGPP
jgi:hypothetical protein